MGFGLRPWLEVWRKGGEVHVRLLRSALIHMDVLDLTELVVPVSTEFPADPTLLVSAERVLGAEEMVVIDPDRSALHTFGNTLGPLDVR